MEASNKDMYILVYVCVVIDKKNDNIYNFIHLITIKL